MKEYLKISVLVDNPDSWFNAYLDKLCLAIRKFTPRLTAVRNARNLRKGDILFILSCDCLLTKEKLSLHRNNIIVHESDLPKGRGWSPLSWQVESGSKRVPLTLFEGGEDCDAGNYYFKDYIKLDGSELIEEIRNKQADKTIEMIEKFLSLYPKIRAKQQAGKPTYYPKRTPRDNELDINKSIKEQFDKMRIADNQRYPLHFSCRGSKYILKIYNAKGKI